MSISTAMLAELDQEMIGTRQTLERIPEDKFDWQPHPKSFTTIALATHIVNMLGWGSTTINEDSFDFAPEGSEPYVELPAASKEELLQKFDAGLAGLRAALSGASDEAMFKDWSLLAGGKPIFTMPRVACLRGFVFNHLIHHRAQLTVYLRMNDVPVPALYGPSADEGSM